MTFGAAFAQNDTTNFYRELQGHHRPSGVNGP